MNSGPQKGLSLSVCVLSECLSMEVWQSNRCALSPLPWWNRKRPLSSFHPVALGAPLIALDRLKGKKERGTVGVLVVSVGPSDSRLFSSLSLEVCPWNGERERRRKGSFLNNRWERILDQTRSRIRPRLSPPDKKGVRVDWKETRNTFSNKYGFIKS